MEQIKPRSAKPETQTGQSPPDKAAIELAQQALEAARPAQTTKSPSPETRAKISAKLKGRKLPASTRAKMSQSRRGKSPSAETRVKIGNSRRGKTHSQKSKKLMSAARKGRKNPRSDQSIELIKQAIWDHALGLSMAQASRNQLFESGWLAAWGRRHPKRFKALHRQAIAEQKAGGSYILDRLPYPDDTPTIEVELEPKRRIAVALSPQEFDPRYLSRGNCANSPPAWFVGNDKRMIPAAKRVCSNCQVGNDCLEAGLSNEHVAGIWGGTTEDERQKIIAARQKTT